MQKVDMLYLLSVFTCETYGHGHTYVKSVMDPTKKRKLKANRINKGKDEILKGEDLMVEWLVLAIKFLNSSTIYKKYERFF
jgi:hypothetical protein